MRPSLAVSGLLVFLIPHEAMAETTSSYHWPVRPHSAYHTEGHHMLWYDDKELKGFHFGEDWNRGKGSTDDGDALYPIAAGRVVFVGEVTGKGNVIIVRHVSPNGSVVDSLYAHCKEISNKIIAGKTDVSPDQKIAAIGGTGGVIPHLHWEIQKDLSLPPGENPYVGGRSPRGIGRKALTVQHALKYTSPSLYVDDRAVQERYLLASSRIRTIEVFDFAPSSLAYVITLGGEKISLRHAVQRKMISISGWTDDFIFRPDRTYSVRARQGISVLVVAIPGYGYPDDRARMDLIGAAEDAWPAELTTFDTRTFKLDKDWHANWRLSSMSFRTPAGAVTMFHILHKTNALARATTYWDPVKRAWTGWRFKEANDLD